VIVFFFYLYGQSGPWQVRVINNCLSVYLDALIFAFVALFVYSAVWIFPGMLHLKLGRLNYYLSGKISSDLQWSS
jgi:hypothetical protein